MGYIGPLLEAKKLSRKKEIPEISRLNNGFFKN